MNLYVIYAIRGNREKAVVNLAEALVEHIGERIRRLEGCDLYAMLIKNVGYYLIIGVSRKCLEYEGVAETITGLEMQQIVVALDPLKLLSEASTSYRVVSAWWFFGGRSG